MQSAIAYPHHGSVELRAAFALRYAILAPSSHNSQPWLFHVEGDTIELHADSTRVLPSIDPEHRELTISCGAALHHLRTAFAAVGESIEVTRCLADDRLARIRLLGQTMSSARARRRLDAALERRTVRTRLEDPPAHDEVIEELEQAAREERCTLVFADVDRRHRLAGLVAAGDVVQASSTELRRELSRWIHSNTSTHDDGMPASTLGFGDLASFVAPLIVRSFDWGKMRASQDHDLVESSPLVAVLGTRTDERRDWLAAGEALSAILLDAAARGVAASFLNQPLEVTELRSVVANVFREAAFPQLIVRLGVPAEVPREIDRSARRPMDDVVV